MKRYGQTKGPLKPCLVVDSHEPAHVHFCTTLPHLAAIATLTRSEVGALITQLQGWFDDQVRKGYEADYGPLDDRKDTVHKLLRFNRITANALLEILDEAESDKDWDIVTTAAKQALQEIAS